MDLLTKLTRANHDPRRDREGARADGAKRQSGTGAGEKQCSAGAEGLQDCRATCSTIKPAVPARMAHVRRKFFDLRVANGSPIAVGKKNWLFV